MATAAAAAAVRICTLRTAMRRLWEDHVTWTRVFLISAIAGLPDQHAATARLLRNQVDIGDAVKKFYGNAAGDQLTSLLHDHIMLAAELVAALVNRTPIEQAMAKWFANADQIAAFLSRANPKHWPLAEMTKMMRSHLELTTKEALARLNQEWDADVAAYDEVHEQILKMADMLAFGIAEQFPTKL